MFRTEELQRNFMHPLLTSNYYWIKTFRSRVFRFYWIRIFYFLFLKIIKKNNSLTSNEIASTIFGVDRDDVMIEKSQMKENQLIFRQQSQASIGRGHFVTTIAENVRSNHFSIISQNPCWYGSVRLKSNKIVYTDRINRLLIDRQIIVYAFLHVFASVSVGGVRNGNELRKCYCTGVHCNSNNEQWCFNSSTAKNERSSSGHSLHITIYSETESGQRNER